MPSLLTVLYVGIGVMMSSGMVTVVATVDMQIARTVTPDISTGTVQMTVMDTGRDTVTVPLTETPTETDILLVQSNSKKKGDSFSCDKRLFSIEVLLISLSLRKTDITYKL